MLALGMPAVGWAQELGIAQMCGLYDSKAGNTLYPYSSQTQKSPGCVVFAHMVNTIEAVDWAMGLNVNGYRVNGLELDLRFNKDNMPSEFRHSTYDPFDACDCTAGYASQSFDNVCKHIGAITIPAYIPNIAHMRDITNTMAKTQGLCFAQTPAADMLAHLADSRFSGQLAVVYIDSKVDKADAPPDLAAAGKNVIQFLDTNLFGKGYQGQVIVSTGETKYSAYTKAAIAQAALSVNMAQYFFTFDGQSSAPNLLPSPDAAKAEFKTAVQTLIDLGTRHRFYAVGIAGILPGTFYDQIALATYNKKKMTVSGTGIWTLDSTDAMNKYLDLGVESIMTNRPGDALSVFANRHIRMGWGMAFGWSYPAPVFTELPAGERCESNSNCGNGACARGTAADAAHKVCCNSGQFGSYGPYDYCYGMPQASTCWSNAMCSSGNCKGNGELLSSGVALQKGSCQ
ncbi:MAG: hypothetical protein D4S02_12615 [Rhodocyclaceae bacterium]|nr:MAG: hypothetical protein D4S02_12615 [Rhodocyclaceae bacterium]